MDATNTTKTTAGSAAVEQPRYSDCANCGSAAHSIGYACPCACHKRRGCKHMVVTVVGGEETAVRSIRCAQCGSNLTRRNVNGEYIYSVSR